MSAAPPVLPLHVGDYLTDTAYLTIEQSGAYLHILMYGWRSGRIPDNEVDLARLCRVTTRYWRAAIAPALMPFFAREGGLLISKRLEKERHIAVEKSEKQRKRIASRWSAKPNGAIKENNELPDTAVIPPTRATPLPLPCTVQESTPLPPSKTGDAEFALFWAAYPRRQDRGHAEKAWATARKTSSAAIIIAGLRGYRFNADQKYIPLPATWLNGRRWADEQLLPVEAPSAAQPEPRYTTTPWGTKGRVSEVSV